MAMAKTTPKVTPLVTPRTRPTTRPKIMGAAAAFVESHINKCDQCVTICYDW